MQTIGKMTANAGDGVEAEAAGGDAGCGTDADSPRSATQTAAPER
jgi:hypothetical protein